MAKVEYSNLDRAKNLYDYNNDDYLRRRKLATAVDNWNKNPYFMLGNMIGQAIFEPYFDKKRNKSARLAHENTVGKNASEPAKENKNMATKTDWDEMNKYLDAYTSAGNSIGADANVVYGVPRTPQQSGQKPITPTDNGLNTVAQGWNNLVNGSSYNYGNTPVVNPTGARDLSNVMPQFAAGPEAYTAQGMSPAQANIMANRAQKVLDARNALLGTPVAATPAAEPKAPIQMSYTPEQLAQIAAQNYTADELRKMGAEQFTNPVSVAVPPTSTTSGTVPVSPSVPPSYTPNPLSETDDHAPYYANPLSEADDHEPSEAGLLSSSGQAYLDDYRKRGSLDLQKLFDDVLHRKIFG